MSLLSFVDRLGVVCKCWGCRVMLQSSTRAKLPNSATPGVEEVESQSCRDLRQWAIVNGANVLWNKGRGEAIGS